jgi:hypothetical protein
MRTHAGANGLGQTSLVLQSGFSSSEDSRSLLILLARLRRRGVVPGSGAIGRDDQGWMRRTRLSPAPKPKSGRRRRAPRPGRSSCRSGMSGPRPSSRGTVPLDAHDRSGTRRGAPAVVLISSAYSLPAEGEAEDLLQPRRAGLERPVPGAYTRVRRPRRRWDRTRPGSRCRWRRGGRAPWEPRVPGWPRWRSRG